MEEKKFILDEIIEYLNSTDFQSCQKHEDGRKNSDDDEEQIIDLLVNKFPDNIKKTVIRDWYDVCIVQDGEIYPTNIKSSGMKSADNASSFKSLIWTFTDVPFVDIEKKVTGHDAYIKALLERRKSSSRDYYFLVYDKKNKKFFFNTLKSLKTITPNGSNLPFQIHWGKNKERDVLSEQDSYNRVMAALKSSIQKRLGSFNGYEKL